MVKVYSSNVFLDFEVGLQNAIFQAFPLSEIKGCYFHFVQSLRRNLEKYPSLRAEIIPGRIFFPLWMRLRALPFIDVSGVTFAYGLIKGSVANTISTDLLSIFAFGYLHSFQNFSHILKKHICMVQITLPRVIRKKCGTVQLFMNTSLVRLTQLSDGIAR